MFGFCLDVLFFFRFLRFHHDCMTDCYLLPLWNWIQSFLDRKWFTCPVVEYCPWSFDNICGNFTEFWREGDRCWNETFELWIARLGEKTVLFNAEARSYSHASGNAHIVNGSEVMWLSVVFRTVSGVAAATSLQTGCWWWWVVLPLVSTQPKTRNNPRKDSFSLPSQLTFLDLWCQ